MRFSLFRKKSNENNFNRLDIKINYYVTLQKQSDALRQMCFKLFITYLNIIYKNVGWDLDKRKLEFLIEKDTNLK